MGLSLAPAVSRQHSSHLLTVPCHPTHHGPHPPPACLCLPAACPACTLCINPKPKTLPSSRPFQSPCIPAGQYITMQTNCQHLLSWDGGCCTQSCARLMQCCTGAHSSAAGRGLWRAWDKDSGEAEEVCEALAAAADAFESDGDDY